MRYHSDALAMVIAHRSPRGGQQDVGHEGVATRGGALSLCTPPETEISSITRKILSLKHYFFLLILVTLFVLHLRLSIK